MSDSPFSRLPEEIPWERYSPGIYLSESFTALLELFDPYGPQQPLGAAYHRVRWARIAVVFAAFAGEGYINRVLMGSLSDRDFQALDRLPTVDKYVLGPRLAIGSALFDRGAQPLQTIAELFELRNKMAHPKPRSELITRDRLLAGPEAETYTPSDAVRYVMAVAEAALALNRALDEPEDQFAASVVSLKSRFTEIARSAEELPMPTLDDYDAAYGRMQASAVERLADVDSADEP